MTTRVACCVYHGDLLALYLSDYRDISDREMLVYTFRGMYAAILLRASFPMIDYQSMLIKYGNKPEGQSAEEAEEIMKYQSSLDRVLVNHILDYLEKDPI